MHALNDFCQYVLAARNQNQRSPSGEGTALRRLSQQTGSGHQPWPGPRIQGSLQHHIYNICMR
jgi:hypothetical protein